MGTMITIDSLPVYEVRPKGKCIGGLIVIHEVWGLTDHIKDVAERFAREGYYVIAPNLLHQTDIEQHTTSDMAKDLFDPEKRSAVQPALRELMAPLQTPEFANLTIEHIAACFDWLYDRPAVTHKVAVIGYCFGGSYSFSLAIKEPKLRAAVPYYGQATASVEALRGIACPIYAFYGEKDERLLQSLPMLEEDMHEAAVDFTAEVYEGAGHAFFNDTNPFAYNEHAANDAWPKTLNFLKQAMDDA
jgi:carboxymethylenebutenolidase